MALEHAILVSLAEKASSGYELARRFDKSIGQFWTATHQQIYKVLARMESDGWVAGEHVEQDGRPDKKVYRVTDTGRAVLADWVGAPTRPDVGRSELAVKIRAASLGDVDALRDEIARHREIRQQRLDGYLANAKHEFPRPDNLRGQRLHQYLVLQGGIALERTLIDWYDDVLAALRREPTRKARS